MTSTASRPIPTCPVTVNYLLFTLASLWLWINRYNGLSDTEIPILSFLSSGVMYFPRVDTYARQDLLMLSYNYAMVLALITAVHLSSTYLKLPVLIA